MAKVLLAGESWVSAVVDHKGYDAFPHTQVHIGCAKFLEVLRKAGHDVTHLKSHDVAEEFPLTRQELDNYDVIILSDIGSNTLLLPPQVFEDGRPTANRFTLLKEWVHDGGGLMMAGGYLSFQGFQGMANYAGTAIEEILPVNISRWDDRKETPEGISGHLTTHDHDIVNNLDDTWPILLGYQILEPKEDAHVLAEIEGNPLLAIRTVGQGRTLAFASDISPHWAPEEFMSWNGYQTLFDNCVTWLAR
ncbi:glutamine amidotransferase [Timonella sp. A28]|uniref:glutamine amidotransferase n=1 Tax=Timonella sp. A28 TaxID=3442640 RepID=UPI003EBA6FA2